MSAEFVPGVTFAQGGTYTAGHFNDYVRAAVVTGIDRVNVNFTLGVFITRDANQIPAPTDKELWADQNASDLVTSFFTGGFSPAFQGSAKTIFNVGNGNASQGAVMQVSTTNPIGGIPVVGLSAVFGSPSGFDTGIVGVAYRTNATEGTQSRVYIARSGVYLARVSGQVTVGDWLRIVDPSDNHAPAGAFIVNNNQRDVGINDPLERRVGFVTAQAIDNKTSSGVGTVLVKIIT